jgi:hypothetical protein
VGAAGHAVASALALNPAAQTPVTPPAVACTRAALRPQESRSKEEAAAHAVAAVSAAAHKPNSMRACTLTVCLPTVSAEHAVALAEAHAAHMAEQDELAAARVERWSQKSKGASRPVSCKDPTTRGRLHRVSGEDDVAGSATFKAAVPKEVKEVKFHADTALDTNESDEDGGVDGWKAFQQLHAANKSMEHRNETVDELADLFGLPGTTSKFVARTLAGADFTFGPELRAQVTTTFIRITHLDFVGTHNLPLLTTGHLSAHMSSGQVRQVMCSNKFLFDDIMRPAHKQLGESMLVSALPSSSSSGFLGTLSFRNVRLTASVQFGVALRELCCSALVLPLLCTSQKHSRWLLH